EQLGAERNVPRGTIWFKLKLLAGDVADARLRLLERAGCRCDWEQQKTGDSMEKTAVLSSLRSLGLVPVLRAESEEQALALADAIAKGGVTTMEVTMTVPGAIRVMRKLTEARPDLL